MNALGSWIQNPYEGNRAEVKVNRISRKETVFMWGLAAVVVCFVAFLVNDFYGFVNWRKMEKRQSPK